MFRKKGYLPVEITITREQEEEFFQEFAPILHVVTASCVNLGQSRDFVKFAYFCRALDLLLCETWKVMSGLKEN